MGSVTAAIATTNAAPAITHGIVDAGLVLDAPRTGLPHCVQKRAAGVSVALQEAHAAPASGLPHAEQKLP